jgi:hypothetical protein
VKHGQFIKAKDMNTIQAREMRYLRSVKGCIGINHIEMKISEESYTLFNRTSNREL